jgi:hypothetical protein
MLRTLLSLGLILALPLAAARADVIVVSTAGGGDFSSLQAAVNAASDGDILLLKSYAEPGVTPTALPDKSLTIVGDVAGPAKVAKLTLTQLAAGRTLVLQNLEIPYGLELQGAAGSVRVEACVAHGTVGDAGLWQVGIYPTPGTPGMLITDCEDVMLARCTPTGGAGAILEDHSYQWAASDGGPGVRVVDSLVTLASCESTGGQGGWAESGGASGAAGGAAIENDSSQVLLYGGRMSGGNGGSGDFSGFGCGYGGYGGDGLHSLGDAALTWLRGVILTGGNGGAAGCSSGGNGSPGQTSSYSGNGESIHFTGGATRFTVDSPVRELQTVTLSIDSLPGDVVWTWLSLDATQVILPKYQGELLVGSPFASLLLGVVGANGKLGLQGQLPELGPGLDGVAVPLQSFVNRQGAWLLGPVSILVGLDGSL